MKKEKITKKVTTFLKRHWKPMLIGVGCAAGGIICLVVAKGKSTNLLVELKSHELIEVLTDELELPAKAADEDIFTKLAPAIEEAVLEKSLEKVVLERFYDLGDNVHKVVTATVENVYGD